jgi:hypothetical protein
MRHLAAFVLLVAFAVPCQAQPKPNTLTPKEIADGWILLFDGETTLGWEVDAGALKVAHGDLQIGGTKAVQARTSIRFCSYELRYDYLVRPEGEWKGTGPDSRYAGFFLPQAKMAFGSRPTKSGQKEIWRSEVFYVDIEKRVFKHASILDGHLQLKEGEAVRPLWEIDAGTILLLRNIKLRPLNTKPLFNGKDLDGWKEFPGKKSKFAVIDNAINVKDGPGDLQTAGKYKDFILQVDCISHGKHLNSGIFFRCRDGEYQNGYEAQIRNEFKDEPQKYLVEEYDPKTNKLIGKKEVLSKAFDFGTGAIYRRQPARKQMSKDGEWFTMTIVAHGNHFATWVNGVQVADWTDNRPKSDNARTGCRLEGGHISIQGHDPATNLSFKNFRIAEMK